MSYSGGYVRGVADDSEEFRQIMHQADENLLEAKRSGKNKVVGSRYVRADSEKTLLAE